MPPAHAAYIRQTYALAQQAAAHGNHPFGALLVRDGAVVLAMENTVHTASDPTRHAELSLVSQAAQQFTAEELAASTLYTSTEPCMMCSGAIYWAGIPTVVYGCSEQALAAAVGSADFLTPCRDVFARGARPVTVIGPVLEEEGAAIHRRYWPQQS